MNTETVRNIHAYIISYTTHLHMRLQLTFLTYSILSYAQSYIEDSDRSIIVLCFFFLAKRAMLSIGLICERMKVWK